MELYSFLFVRYVPWQILRAYIVSVSLWSYIHSYIILRESYKIDEEKNFPSPYLYILILILI